MTSGEPAVTTGGRRFQLGAWHLIAAIGLVVAAVNATSELLEARRDGYALDPRAPFIWEISSYILVVSLAPLIGLAVKRLPPRRDNLVVFGLVHAGLTVAFSLAHVIGMVALRKIAYALDGSFYNFTHGDALVTFFYEWRKDVLSYALLGSVYWLFQHYRTPAPAPAPVDRLEVRDGGAAFFVAPAEISWIEAAGNYVEVHAGARTHLVRGTLAAWEAKLAGAGFARVHRSRLVNRARIRAIKPTPSGDFAITLDDGAELAGSRRYRAALDRAALSS